MIWGVSSVAFYVPWAGGAGPWISVSLWLWLGVLDATQGVGLGMILLQTLSRLHVCATLAFSQMLGSVIVIVARPTVPRDQVFPDFALWNVGNGFKHSPFASVGSCWCARSLSLSATSSITEKSSSVCDIILGLFYDRYI
jgi:alpha-1,3-glucan synthase